MLSSLVDFATDWSNRSFFMDQNNKVKYSRSKKSAEKENHDDDDETNNQKMMRCPPPSISCKDVGTSLCEDKTCWRPR